LDTRARTRFQINPTIAAKISFFMVRSSDCVEPTHEQALCLGPLIRTYWRSRTQDSLVRGILAKYRYRSSAKLRARGVTEQP
jgi:hypothetical protein